MTELDELMKAWKANQSVRTQWYSVLQTVAFPMASRIAEVSAMEKAESYTDNMPDELLARRLAAQQGAREALRVLKHLCDPDPVEEKDPEPFAHIDETYLERKPQQQTE